MRRSGEAIVGTKSSWLERVLGVADARSARVGARAWRRGGVGLIILCLLVYIPGLWTIPPVDRDESRFAQASRQMLESGTLEGWVVPRVQDKPRLNKPPLIYWLQASSAAILGDRPQQWAWLDGGSENIWVYRVPSVLSALASVLLTWRLGVRMFDPRAAWLGAAFLAVCPMVVWDAHQARADQLLLATTTATMLALWCVWGEATKGKATEHAVGEALRVEGSASTPRSSSVPPCLRGEVRLRWVLAFWGALALGIMTKGPITPMIAALTCTALSVVARDWRWILRLRPVLGVLIVAAVVSPWLILVGNAVGWSNYLHIIYDETIGRSAGAKEGHWGPPGYHIVLLGVLFWPGSLLTAAAIGRAWKRGMRSSFPAACAPPPPPAGEVSNEALRVRRRGCEDGPDASPTPSVTLEDSRVTSPAGGGGGAIRRLTHHLVSLRPSRPAELFLLAWMLPAWLVFELVSTKLPHYTMPLYPAVALMSARMLLQYASRRPRFRADAANGERLLEFLAEKHAPCPMCRYDLHAIDRCKCPECGSPLACGLVRERGPGPWWRRARMPRVMLAGVVPSQRNGEALWWIIGIVMTSLVPLALLVSTSFSFAPDRGPFPFRFEPSLALLLAGIALLVACWWFATGSLRFLKGLLPLAATWRAMIVLTLVYATLFAVVLPRADHLWVSREIARALREHDPNRSMPLADVGYFEDSFVFITRGRAQRITDHDTLAKFIQANSVSLVLQDGPMLDATLNSLRDYEGQEYRGSYVQWISGYNYSKGEPVSVQLRELRHE